MVFFLVISVVVYFAFPEKLYQIIRDSEQKAANLSEESIQVDEHLFSYYEGGTGETIILVHGFSAEKHHWAAMAKELVPRYHVIFPDLPRHGKNTRLQTASYDYQSQVDRLNRFIDLLKLDKVHLVGNSMGGSIVGLFAFKYPQKVLSLALFDSAGVNSPEPSDSRKVFAETGENVLLINNTNDFDRALEYGFFRVPFIPGPIKKILVSLSIQNRPFNTKIWHDFTKAPTSLEPLLAAIETPTLILWGKADRIIHVSSVSVFEQHLKNHQTVILEACGHVPMLEKPKETAGHYLKFLSHIDPAN